MKSLAHILIIALTLTFSVSVHAEKADAKKPTNVESEQMQYDDVAQVNTFIGHAHLTRGTLIMKGHKMVIKQDPAGYQYATLYAPAGGLAFFRHRSIARF